MVDFYSALARKIRQVQDDPARMREVVYEAARLALRWQVAERGSLSAMGELRRLKVDLEEAIARLEAEAAAAALRTGPSPSARAAPLPRPREKRRRRLRGRPQRRLGRKRERTARGDTPRCGAGEITGRDRRPRACRSGGACRARCARRT